MPIHLSSGGRPNLAHQFRQRLFLVTGMLLLMLLLLLGVDIYTTANSSALRTEIVIIHDGENQFLSAMVNQETGLRGYIVTTDSIFLQPFDLGRSQYLSALPSLSRALHQEGWQDAVFALSQAQARAETWYSTFALSKLHQVRMGDLASARSPQSELGGKALFDAFRSSFAHLQQILESDETTLLMQQTQFHWNVLLASALLSAFALVLLWHTFMAFRRDLTTQLASLTTMAQHVQAGQRQMRVPSLKHEELELVGQTFNHLIEALLQQQETIEEHARQMSTVNGEFQALFNAVNMAILFVAHDGHILAVNRSFTECFHLSADTLTGQRLDDVRAHWVSLFAEGSVIQGMLEDRSLDETEIVTATVKQIAPQRRDFQLQVCHVFSTTSSHLGRLFLFRDITKQNELERLKRDFVSHVSHELRTPLTSIKGFVNVLLDDPVHLNTEQREFLSIVLENADRLVTLVNDLLSLSRIEAGKIELECTSFDLNELIEHTLQSFAPQLTSKQQSLELHLQEPSPIVFADPARVQQILSNLVSNAYKYTLSEGTLHVSTGLKGGEVWIQIQDSGIGMTPEEQTHLFTSFFRAKNRLTEEAGGTGLGLVITRSLVELHGGKMHVESQSGRGSTFRFTLPLAPKALHFDAA